MDFVVDNRRAFAATGGRPLDVSKPVIVLIHGAGQDRTIWALQTRYLAHHGFSVLAIDLPGHGQSDGPPLATIEQMSQWVHRLLVSAGIQKASVVGHSMGAFVALQVAADFPETIERVALVSVAIEMPVHPELLEAAKANEQHAVDLMNGWSLSGTGHRGGHQTPGTWMLGAGSRTIERSKPGVLFADLSACSNRGSMIDVAASVQAPTLFILGQLDKMTPARSATQLAENVNDGKVEIIEGVGHALLSEAPSVITEQLGRFLKQET